MAAKVTVRWYEDGTLKTGGLDDCAAASKCQSSWVDVLDPDQATMRELQDMYGLHPLAVEDSLEFPQRPKLDTYDNVLFLVWVMPEKVDGEGLDLAELDVFLGKTFLITTRREGIDVIDQVAADDGEILSHGPAWTLHALLDRGVDLVFPIMDGIGDDLDDLEDQMAEATETTSLRALYAEKRLLRNMHKVIGTERDALRGLARAEAFVSQEAYLYFQDVSDHLARVEDAVDTYRDMASGIMDIYLSSVSNRLNVIMKQLTMVATIFMPLTFIAGWYGMNFRHMPEIQQVWGYPGVIAISLLTVGGMFLYFKRKGWW